MLLHLLVLQLLLLLLLGELLQEWLLQFTSNLGIIVVQAALCVEGSWAACVICACKHD